MLSVSHRLLALALRRGALKHYSTIEELLDGGIRTIALRKSLCACRSFLLELLAVLE